MGAHGDALAASGRGPGFFARAEAARGRMLARLAPGFVHEARNPLNALAIHLEVLSDKLRDVTTGAVPAHLLRNLDAARGQLRRLDGLLHRFSELAHASEATEPLAACLERARVLAEYHLRRAGATLRLEVDAESGERIPAVACEAVIALLLAASHRATAGSVVVLRGRAADGSVVAAVEGTGEEGVERAAAEADAAASIAAELGGEIAFVAGPRWRWELRLPSLSRENHA